MSPRPHAHRRACIVLDDLLNCHNPGHPNFHGLKMILCDIEFFISFSVLQIDPSSETDEDEEHTGANVNSSMEVANKFIRNGNEIRRSLRRINSLTRCVTNDPTVLSLDKQNYRDLKRIYNKFENFQHSSNFQLACEMTNK